MATTVPTLICPQGHGPGVPGSRFCNFCGVPLLPASSEGAARFAAPAPRRPHRPQASSPSARFAAATRTADPPIVCAEMWMAAPSASRLPVGSFGLSVGARRSGNDQAAKNLRAPQRRAPPQTRWAGRGSNRPTTAFASAQAVARRVEAGGSRGAHSRVPRMPDVYVRAIPKWNTYTFGSDTSAFIVLGTAILTNFQNDELLFVLAREMGHCRAGHALWKTVTALHRWRRRSARRPALQRSVERDQPIQLIQGAVEIHCWRGRANRRSPPTAPGCSPSGTRPWLAVFCWPGRSVLPGC